MTRTVGVLNRVSSLGKKFSAALLLWRKILLSHLPFFKSRAKCHVSRATLDSRPRGALMLKLTPLSPLLKVVRCAVRTRCVVPQWCKERDESPRIPQRRAEGRAGAQTLDFGRFGHLSDMRDHEKMRVARSEKQTQRPTHKLITACKFGSCNGSALVRHGGPETAIY